MTKDTSGCSLVDDHEFDDQSTSIEITSAYIKNIVSIFMDGIVVGTYSKGDLYSLGMSTNQMPVIHC